jgi:hypothetical protein
VGCTPGIDPVTWFTEILPKRPHWQGPSVGGGAGGNRGGGSFDGANPWTAESWDMTKQGAMYRQDPAKAAKMAESAGTSIGGAKPKLRK